MKTLYYSTGTTFHLDVVWISFIRTCYMQNPPALLKCHVFISDFSNSVRRTVAFRIRLTCNRVKAFPFLESVSRELMHEAYRRIPFEEDRPDRFYLIDHIWSKIFLKKISQRMTLHSMGYFPQSTRKPASQIQDESEHGRPVAVET